MLACSTLRCFVKIRYDSGCNGVKPAQARMLVTPQEPVMVSCKILDRGCAVNRGVLLCHLEVSGLQIQMEVSGLQSQIGPSDMPHV